MDPAEVALVRRLWLPVARIEDLPPGGIVAAQIMDTEIVLWRSTTGAVTASPASCPHRGAFLADGHVVDDNLECPYHGWRFRPGDGVCVLTPSSGVGATPVRTSLFILAKNTGISGRASASRSSTSRAFPRWTATNGPSPAVRRGI
jgi:nitrite reductase/ring-hydroxylating ferredoxin subunit